MIQISLTSALAFYSAVLGCVVLVIWIYTEIVVRRSYNVLTKQFLWRCVFCGYTYLDEDAADLSQCPRCESYNSARDKHARLVRTRPSTHRFDEDQLAQEPQASRRNPSHRKSPQKRRRGPRKR